MSESDVVNLVVAIATVLIVIGGFIGWLLRHGSRLTSVEVRLESISENAERDRIRNDSMWSQISSALVRIEDKLDRKVDR